MPSNQPRRSRPPKYTPTLLYESDGVRITRTPIGLMLEADHAIDRDGVQNLHAFLTGHLTEQPPRYPKEDLGNAH